MKPISIIITLLAPLADGDSDGDDDDADGNTADDDACGCATPGRSSTANDLINIYRAFAD